MRMAPSWADRRARGFRGTVSLRHRLELRTEEMKKVSRPTRIGAHERRPLSARSGLATVLDDDGARALRARSDPTQRGPRCARWWQRRPVSSRDRPRHGVRTSRPRRRRSERRGTNAGGVKASSIDVAQGHAKRPLLVIETWKCSSSWRRSRRLSAQARTRSRGSGAPRRIGS
jgi:hypothetical protein